MVGVLMLSWMSGAALAASPRAVDADQVARVVEARGSPVTLVHVWATWCGPCKAAFAPLNELAAAEASRGLAVVALAVDEDVAPVRRYLDGRRTSWTDYHVSGDPRALARSLADLGGRWDGGVPYDLLIDSDGRVLDQ
jgi:thiol-disulfide isomerase/thioredoxin